MANLILVEGRTYPLVKPLMHYNTVFISPWTGETWARIDRGCREWFSQRWAARGEHPYPTSDSIPGTLFTPYDDWRFGALAELPLPLIMREISLIEGLTRATLSCDNGATLGDTLMTPDLLKEIAELRTKVASNTISDQELRDALKKMREGRVTAGAASAAKKAKATPVNPDEALAAFLS